MPGMNRRTGRAIEGQDHLYQSVEDILTTRVRTRIGNERRRYGLNAIGVIDQPTVPGLRGEIIAAVAEALDRWEPRFKLERVNITNAAPGSLTLDLRGKEKLTGRDVVIEGLVI